MLLGATFVGPDVAEMLHAATVAIVGEVPAARLAHAIPAFPMRSEIWLRLLAKYEQAECPQKRLVYSFKHPFLKGLRATPTGLEPVPGT